MGGRRVGSCTTTRNACAGRSDTRRRRTRGLFSAFRRKYFLDKVDGPIAEGKSESDQASSAELDVSFGILNKIAKLDLDGGGFFYRENLGGVHAAVAGHEETEHAGVSPAKRGRRDA